MNGRALKHTLILATGNTLRADDGVAWRIAQAIENSLVRDGVEVVFAQQLMPEHAALLSEADLAVFIDCSALEEAGDISVLSLAPALTMPRLFTHHLDPASLLTLAHNLYGHVPSSTFAVTVGGSFFELNQPLSSAVESAIPRAIEAVQNIVSNTGTCPDSIQRCDSKAQAPIAHHWQGQLIK
jgi:hydrogenase maturation protease